MDWTQIETFYKTQAAVGDALGWSPQRVHNYSKRGKLPLEAQLEVEIATQGKLLADLPEYFRKQALRQPELTP
jgi:ParB-like chromosome segregation protein Spo0J